MAEILRLIDVNAGGFRLKKGQRISHPNIGDNAILEWARPKGNVPQTWSAFSSHLSLSSIDIPFHCSSYLLEINFADFNSVIVEEINYVERISWNYFK